MNSSQYIPSRGFWRATVFVIIITVSAVVLRGAGPGNGGGTVANLWLTVGLAIIPGSCVGILQAFLIKHDSVWAQLKWFVITAVSVAIGWCTVFAIMSALLAHVHSLPAINNGQFFQAAFYGCVLSALVGAIVGSVSGLIQAYIQHLPARHWISSNVISWSLGIAIPVVTFFVLLSLMNFFFVF